MIAEKELLPSGWYQAKLGEFFHIKHGYAFSGKNFSQEKNNKPLLSPGNFKPQGGIKFDWDKQKFYDGEVSKDFILKKGDLIIAMTDLTKACIILGSPAIIPDSNFDYLHNQRLGLVENLDTSKLDANYLFHYFNHNVYRKYLRDSATGTTVSHTSPKVVYEVGIPLPTLPEQQKIAEILSTVDAKIEVIDQQITEAQELKKGLMQRLLTKGIGHTEFKDSPLGEIPKSWEMVKVGDVCKLQGGFAFKSSDSTEHGVRWVKIANVGVHKIKWETESFLPEGYDEKHPNFVLKTNDVVIAMTRPILSGQLKIAKITEKDSGSLLNQRVGKIVVGDGIDSEYSYQVFNSSIFINSMEKELVGTDPPNISSKMFEELMIPLPPLSEQVEIVDILNTVDDKKRLLDSKLIEFKKLKKGLMQQLLTGKIRVNGLINKTVNA